MGRVRAACRERGDQEQHTPANLDQQQHCRVSACAAALWVQLRLAARNFDVRAGILPLESVVFSADAGARAGVSKEEPRQLVPEVLYGAGDRTGGYRILLAA